MGALERHLYQHQTQMTNFREQINLGTLYIDLSFCPYLSHPLSFFWEPFFFFFLIYFIYLFLVELGFRCCKRAFSSCGERALLFVAVRGLLTAVSSLVEEHRL